MDARDGLTVWLLIPIAGFVGLAVGLYKKPRIFGPLAVVWFVYANRIEWRPRDGPPASP